jgi:adenylate cyclase
MKALLARFRFKRSSPKALIPATLTVGTILIVVALFVAQTPVFDTIELNWLDLRFRTRGKIPPSPNVVLAVIDERSLGSEGRWPWPRSKFAALIDALSRDGAKVIGFDVTFSESDDNAQLALINGFARTVDSLAIDNPKVSEFIEDSRAKADNDRALVNALKRSSAAVVLGYFFHMDEAAVGYKLDKADIERRLNGISASKYPLVFTEEQADGVSPFIKSYAPQGNLDLFAAAAASTGYFTIVSDPDGRVRWLPLMIQGGDDLFPPLSILCVWHYLGKPQLAVHTDAYGVEGVQIGDRFIPTDESGQLLINYRGPPQTFAHYSISDILGGRLPPGTFADKIVIVGATALGIGDIRSTPFTPVYPGPEIHASVIDNVLTGDFIEKPRWSMVFDLSAIVLLSSVVGIALPRISALKGVLVVVGIAGFYVVAAYELFARAHMWLNMVYPIFGLAGTYTMLTLYRYIAEERERKKIKDTFKYYVSGDVIEDMLSDPDRLKLGGQEKLLTVMFSDLVGFTTYSEKYPPSAVIAILSDYYNRMTEQVFANRGTLTNYIGDELMAIFGAPVEQPDHAKSACLAAIAMREQRGALAEEFAKIGRPPLRARTGINSGVMLVGNVGSKYRFAYTVLGDHVNLASRLEQLNRIYGTETIISEHTAALVANSFILRQLDRVRVKGREQALRIYELVAIANTVQPPKEQRVLELYPEAFEAYQQQRFAEALETFSQCLVLWPEDRPSRLMADRCRLYREHPPENWDGVFEHQTKD